MGGAKKEKNHGYALSSRELRVEASAGAGELL
jgi:hypothetical protein